MSKVQMLRSLVNQRLTVAAEEIFGLFERTIAEYEEELSSSKEENERQRKLLDAVFNPEVRIQRADVQQLLVDKEEVPPEQQDWSSSLDQEDPEPPHIKEEQEELWTSHEGEQLQGLEEADIKFSLTPVKSEYYEEEAQYSQLHQRQSEHMETEADREDFGGPESDWHSDPDRYPEPDTDEKTGDYSEPETEHSGDWNETREPQSGLNSLNNDEVPVSDLRCSTGEKLFVTREILKKRMRMHTGEKPYSCSVCKKCFARNDSLQKHTRVHTGEKPYSCSFCKNTFALSHHLQMHIRVHTGEKPYSCSVCKKYFARNDSLQKHMRVHTGEKPYSCSVCNKYFALRHHLQMHMKAHGRETLHKGFIDNGGLKRHMTSHTREKPYSCSVGKKSFAGSGSLQKHKTIHTR